MHNVTEIVSGDGRSSTVTYGGGRPYPDLDAQIDRALALMNGDTAKAGGLVSAWIRQGSFDPSLVQQLVESHIASRVKARAKARAKAAR